MRVCSPATIMIRKLLCKHLPAYLPLTISESSMIKILSAWKEGVKSGLRLLMVDLRASRSLG